MKTISSLVFTAFAVMASHSVAIALNADEALAIAAPVVVDSGDDAALWTSIASPGATAAVKEAPGLKGGAIALTYDLGRGRSHVIARRELSVDLPDDYMFVFSVKAVAEINNVEIKFISGENVWWRRLADYQLPEDWKDIRVSKSRLEFAWGPAGGGMPAHLDAIEVAIAAGKGGQGELWIDEIRLEPRDGATARRPPSVTTTWSAPGVAGPPPAVSTAPLAADGSTVVAPNGETSGSQAAGANLMDADPTTVWRSEPGATKASVTLDFHQSVEQGGLEIEHAADGFSSAYAIEASNDEQHWDRVREFGRSDGGLDHVFLPDVYARYLRLQFFLAPGQRAGIAEIRPQPFAFSASPNGFFSGIARQSAAGTYPRYFLGEQSYWTVVGVGGDNSEALINEEGAVEVDAGAFTLEPFLWRAGSLRTWKDSTNSVSLEDGDLPIPTVTRRDGELSLAVTAFASGKAGGSTLYVRYRLKAEAATGPIKLFVAMRPFQVLPPWQTLNRVGGVTNINRITRDRDIVRVDDRRVFALTKPTSFGAATFEEGDIGVFLAQGKTPSSATVLDSFAYASAAMAWDLELAAGESRDVWLAVPWSARSKVVGAGAKKGVSATSENAELEDLLVATKREWREQLDRVTIEFPGTARDLVDSMRSNLAYILINRDGPAIQPGSRTYERSWIRDGAMTCGAMLELGLEDEVKQFLRWYAGYLRPDGWVPCCVDGRGADPVPEHDSFGEFIWAVAEVWRFTRDEDFVREMWPRVKAVAGCMSRLRATRMTPEYQSAERRAYFGLLPESISHEGYSARPVHSYWDQAFALRGYADAAMLAEVVGDSGSAASLGAERDSFETSLRESITATIAAGNMDVVPASVELGDFDPTSTAVSFLLGTERVYPADALGRSFDQYVGNLRSRRGKNSRGTGYTAYELRNATALVLLGRKAEAIEMLEVLTADQRPAAWNQWPEITWLWLTEPSFLGDLPHTWIGSTFVHAVRTLLVAEREENLDGKGTSLLVGAGIPRLWLAGGGEVRGRNLPTWFGAVTVRMREEDGGKGETAAVVVELETAVADDSGSSPASAPPRAFVMPPGGILVSAPFGAEVESAVVTGKTANSPSPGNFAPTGETQAELEGNSVRIRRLPTTVIFKYKPPLENLR